MTTPPDESSAPAVEPPTPAEWRDAVLSTVLSPDEAVDRGDCVQDPETSSGAEISTCPSPRPAHLSSAVGMAIAHGGPWELFTGDTSLDPTGVDAGEPASSAHLT